MKRQAERDLRYVIEYLRTKKNRCSSPQGVKEVRIEAVKARARERGKTEQTIFRQLKRATGLDLQGTADGLDLILFRLIQDENDVQR